MPLKPLDRISASQFYWLKQCALRNICSKTTDPLLPTSPKSIAGRITHRMLEEVDNRALDPQDEQAFRERWESEVEKAETEMASSWLSRRFVPLYESVPGLEVLYFQALKRGRDLDKKKLQGTGRGSARAEVWVESSERDVVGRIDRVIDTGSGIILQDYKSGSIFATSDGDSDTNAVKESYAIQMKLYAGLYHDTFSVWPQKLQIIGLNGTDQPVEFSTSESRSLLDEAQDLRSKINRNVSAVQKGVSEPSVLANPTPQGCSFCSYRPGCEAYWEAREKSGTSNDWPVDLRGLVSDQESSMDGSYVLRVEVPGRDSNAILQRIRADMLKGEEQLIREGAYLAAYNLFPRSDGSYVGTSYTAIYSL